MEALVFNMMKGRKKGKNKSTEQWNEQMETNKLGDNEVPVCVSLILCCAPCR